MLINTFLDTEDFVHLYYTEDEPVQPQGCGAGARMASKYPRPPSPPPEYAQVQQPASASVDMTDGVRWTEPAPHRVRAADLYPRSRAHYDEPGLEPGFAPICGEFVQWVGRTADGGTIAMSNYRLHAQPRRRSGPGASVPLRLIDLVEIRDLLHLVVLCKHGRTLRCTFATGEQCVEWWRRLNTALAPVSSVQETFAAAYAAWAKEQPPASVHRALMRASHAPQRHWFGPELERLGFTAKGAWRVTAANAEYKLCPSYPPLLVVPASMGDEGLDSVARFRAMRRVPAVVWRHRGNGAVIARASQPEVGWLGWRSDEDEWLLAAFVTACNADRGLQPAHTNKQTKLLIVDARSYASAVTNRARGGGCECQQYYPNADIQFMSLPNIHHVRRSFQQMRALTAEPSDQTNWHSNLERTLWLQYVSGVLRAAGVVAKAVHDGRPVLVHCSDGWDRTPQIVAAAQLLLDPHYRTVEGFRVLVEREWLDFGHKFADRCGHQFAAEEPNERSPVFLQWLDVVHQLIHQYPCSFQFNEAYLIKLATHVHSCMFGTFLCNTTRERIESRVSETTAHVWHLLQAPAYRNHLYSPHQMEQVLWPECGVRHMRVWWGMFYGGERDDDDQADPPPKVTTLNGLTMTKTRSCDNLLSEGEKRTMQRRSSDPSIAPDVMKLSTLVNKEMERSALTDSCVDELPILPVSVENGDQAERNGLHPQLDYFEGPVRPRDLASGSSSLERELGALGDVADEVIAHTDHVIEHSSDKHDSDTLDENTNGDSTDNGEMVHSVVRAGCVIPDGGAVRAREAMSPDVGVLVDTPDEPAVFVCDAYGEIVGITEAARESARTRNISITWRSISESSNQSSIAGCDHSPNAVRAIRPMEDSVVRPLEDNPVRLLEALEDSPARPLEALEDSPVRALEDNPVLTMDELDNHNSTEGDVDNHNVQMTNHNRPVNGVNRVNGVDAVANRFMEVDINGGTSSSMSSESEGEAMTVARRSAVRARDKGASQLTLCASPRRACCHCARRAAAATATANGMETSGESAASSECWCGVCGASGAMAPGGSRARCVCGGGAGPHGDPLDGLPPAADALQARLHQIILYQKKVVEELSGQLREAREALRRATPSPGAPAPPRLSPSAPSPAQMRSSGGGGVYTHATHSGGSSSSGSASEVEVGEEARGVVWLPDSAAPRCQHCRNSFWLARRRHHCRRCGGIFCGSCSEVSSWGDCGAVRMCRRCRAMR